MTENAIRAAVRVWAESGMFRSASLASEMTIHSVAEMSAHLLQLNLMLEQRSVINKSEPYHGGPIDQGGARPNPTALPVALPEKWEDKTVLLALPHTDQLHQCGTCHGSGHTSCGRCGGFGKVTCGFCGGSGFKTTMTQQPVYSGGKHSYQTVTVRVPCGLCFAGRVNCTCRMGKVTCAKCSGLGQTKTSEVLQVSFRHKSISRNLNTTPVPDELLMKEGGKAVFDAWGLEIDLKLMPAECLAIAKSALDDARKQQGKLVRQRLVVDCVPVLQVEFSARKIERSRIWIYGNSNAIHAPGGAMATSTVGRLFGKLFA